MIQNALVTGGTGFIGRHLVEVLAGTGVRAKCLVRNPARAEHLSDLGAEIATGDLLDADSLGAALCGVDVVFHLAGLTHAPSRDQLQRVNGLGCGVLADACRRQPNPPLLIYVSSLSAAGPTRVTLPAMNENDRNGPISHYGRSKRAGEIEIQKRAMDLPCTILRPGIVFGPHDQGTITLMSPIYSCRLHLVVGFRTPPLSLIYVDDLVRVILSVAEKGERVKGDADGEYSPEGYYFACDDREHPTYWQFGKRLATALDRRVVVWPLWRWVGRAIGAGAELTHRMRGTSSLLNTDKISEATVSSWACSAQKARQQLGFAPRQDLDQALRQTAQWFIQWKQSQ